MDAEEFLEQLELCCFGGGNQADGFGVCFQTGFFSQPYSLDQVDSLQSRRRVDLGSCFEMLLDDRPVCGMFEQLGRAAKVGDVVASEGKRGFIHPGVEF